MDEALDGPLNGVTVTELGMWVAGPATAGLLAEWGATVTKIEPIGGDPLRRVYRSYAGSDRSECPPFDMDNRGKRSVEIDVRTEGGRGAAEALLAESDVFATNLRPSALERLGLDFESVHRRHASLVYVSISGFGLVGADVNRAAYDLGAFWGRSGLATLAKTEACPPPMTGGGFGDHVTALAAVAGVLAALFRRQQTGRGELVDVSLLRTGIYCAGWDLSSYLRFGRAAPPADRTSAANPMWNSYVASDGKWFYLLGVESDRHWPGVATVIGAPELITDARFVSARDRRRNASELITMLDAAFGSRPLREWADRLDERDVWWSPVSDLQAVIEDAQVSTSGAIVDVPAGLASPGHRSIAGPVRFGTTSPTVRAVPGVGEHNV